MYSGDNTGRAEKNAEYIDIDTPEIPADVEWIIAEARIYRGPTAFAATAAPPTWAGCIASSQRRTSCGCPQTLQHAMVLQSDAKVAYLLAYHPRTRQIVYLDMAMADARVSTAQDAMRMRAFLDRFALFLSLFPDGVKFAAEKRKGRRVWTLAGVANLGGSNSRGDPTGKLLDLDVRIPFDFEALR